MIGLGEKVKDKYSPFRGTLVALTQYVYRGSQVGVLPPALDEGKSADLVWLDEDRIEADDEASRPRGF